jgi:hypothetical protein
MRFVLAVASVIGFGGLGIYFGLEGRMGLYWVCLAAAVIAPWFFGMTTGRPRDTDDSE